MTKAKNIFDIIPHYEPRICIAGSASGCMIKSKKNIKTSREIGRQVAINKAILVTGTGPGLPDEAAKAARASGGKTYGISPAISIISHLKKYKSPIEHYDGFLFTGLGVLHHSLINVRSSNGVIILPGGIGTLNEFTIAYAEGKPIGILSGHNGIGSHIKEIIKYSHRKVTNRIVFSSDPKVLVKKLLTLIKKVEVSAVLDDYLVKSTGVVTKIEKKAKK